MRRSCLKKKANLPSPSSLKTSWGKNLCRTLKIRIKLPPERSRFDPLCRVFRTKTSHHITIKNLFGPKYKNKSKILILLLSNYWQNSKNKPMKYRKRKHPWIEVPRRARLKKNLKKKWCRLRKNLRLLTPSARSKSNICRVLLTTQKSRILTWWPKQLSSLKRATK